MDKCILAWDLRQPTPRTARFAIVGPGVRIGTSWPRRIPARLISRPVYGNMHLNLIYVPSISVNHKMRLGYLSENRIYQ